MPQRTPLLSLCLFSLLSFHARPASAQADADGFKLPTDAQPAPPPATAPAPESPPAPTATPAPAAAAPTAPASEPAPAPPATDDEADDADRDHKHKKHKKHKKQHKRERDRDDEQARDEDQGSAAAPAYSGLAFSSSGGTLAFKGRIFALAELAHREETVVGGSGTLVDRTRNSLDLSLASARFGFEYRSPLRWLSADLELEVAGKPQVKDAYILAGKKFFVKAGQFKVPSAALELESPWAIPLARRGLVHDLLSNWLDVAGRRPGVAFGFRCKCELKPRITLGAFQGTTLKAVVPGDRNVDLIQQASLKAQTLAARAEVRLLGVDWGAWYEHRVGSKLVGEFSHYATFGVDATLDHKFESGGLRAWADFSGGESLYVHPDKPGGGDPLFTTVRGLLAYRFGGVALGEPYVEPFGYAALLDPDTEVVSDFATEAALGINAGFWDRARLTLQGEVDNGQRNFPEGFLDNQNPDHMSLLLQAGARF